MTLIAQDISAITHGGTVGVILGAIMVIAWLVRQLERERAAREVEHAARLEAEKAHATRIEVILVAQVERERDVSEQSDGVAATLAEVTDALHALRAERHDPKPVQPPKLPKGLTK